MQMGTFLQTDSAHEMQTFQLPRYRQLPEIDIYLDQLITILQQILHPLFGRETETCITSSMINNYAKQGLIRHPVRKKYGRDHIAYLIFIAACKQVMSIGSIQKMIQIQLNTYPLDTAYDYFCTEFEHTLHAIFSNEELPPDSSSVQTQETKLMRAAISAIAHKIYLSKYLDYFQNVPKETNI